MDEGTGGHDVVMQTLPLGELALLEDLITREQLLATLNYQAERREAAKPDRKLGTLLVHQGYLTRDEVRALLRLQRERGPIDGFVLLERLGSGGMGTVYRAIQKSLEREVALKILTVKASRHERFRARFLQEAKILAQLRHPNLVRAFEVGECRGHLFFAMEFVRGRTARDLIARYGSIPEPEALDYMEQVASAIAHYDEHHILHRDVKPENILVTPTGEAKLADLGLSKRLDEDAHITRPGKTLGTPLYISPELARGDERLDIRSDLYSLGATFYHLVCGQPPFESAASADLLSMHVREIPREPCEVNSLVSEELSQLLMILLEKKPERRFDTPTALVEAIRRVRQGEPPEEPSRGRRGRGARFKEREGSSGERAGFRQRDRDSSSAERAVSRNRAARRAPGNERTPSAKRTVASTPPTNQGRAAVVIALVLAGSVGLGVLLATLGFGGAGVGAPSVDRGSGDSIAELQSLARRDAAAALAQAYSFETGHPGEPEAALARYEALAAVVSPGSSVAADVQTSLGRSRRRLEYLANQAIDDLRVEVRELVDQSQSAQALAKIRAFPVRFQSTSAWEQREELLREVEAGPRRP
jgi:serine/threonine-protein kinase